MKDIENRRKGHGYWERRELKLGMIMGWKELGKEKSQEIELGKWNWNMGAEEFGSWGGGVNILYNIIYEGKVFSDRGRKLALYI